MSALVLFPMKNQRQRGKMPATYNLGIFINFNGCFETGFSNLKGNFEQQVLPEVQKKLQDKGTRCITKIKPENSQTS